MIVTALAPDGTRAMARSSDSDVIEASLLEDPIGRSAAISGSALQGVS
jgi:hypothetical protein